MTGSVKLAPGRSAFFGVRRFSDFAAHFAVPRAVKTQLDCAGTAMAATGAWLELSPCWLTIR